MSGGLSPPLPRNPWFLPGWAPAPPRTLPVLSRVGSRSMDPSVFSQEWLPHAPPSGPPRNSDCRKHVKKTPPSPGYGRSIKSTTCLCELMVHRCFATGPLPSTCPPSSQPRPGSAVHHRAQQMYCRSRLGKGATPSAWNLETLFANERCRLQIQSGLVVVAG